MSNSYFQESITQCQGVDNMPLDYSYDIFFCFDIRNGNPNGDPDSEGDVRYDYETRKISISDKALKRKIRNRVMLLKGNQPPNEIYFTDSIVLNDHNRWAVEQVGIIVDNIQNKKQIKFTHAQRQAITEVILERFWDTRTFGVAMSASQFPGHRVTGPCQIQWSTSLNTVTPLERAITRGSVTNERDADKRATIGRLSQVRHAVFLASCLISATLAQRTGFSQTDFEILLDAIEYMFQEDTAANRNLNMQRMLVVKHEDPLRAAGLDALEDVFEIHQKTKFTETFRDFEIAINTKKLPKGVHLVRNDFETT